MKRRKASRQIKKVMDNKESNGQHENLRKTRKMNLSLDA